MFETQKNNRSKSNKLAEEKRRPGAFPYACGPPGGDFTNPMLMSASWDLLGPPGASWSVMRPPGASLDLPDCVKDCEPEPYQA